MYYSQTTYDSIPEEHRSLVTAYANLVDYLGLSPVTPDVLYRSITSDDPVIDHEVLPEYIKGIALDEVNETATSWPNDNGSIVKVRRYDESKMYYVDHYLLLIDAGQRAVVDSYDGITKNGESYGDIQGYVRYSRQPDRDMQADVQRVTYTVQAGENLWDVARRLNLKFETLKEYNSIDDARIVKEGYVLHLPIHEVLDTSTVRYELLDQPENMHVSRLEGARKVMFGNARVFADISETGRTHAPESNHVIHAIAYVELEDSDVPAAYYMDKFDTGELAVTGMPRYLTGFNHSHMATGHVTSGQAATIPQDMVDKLEQAKDAMPEMVTYIESVPVSEVVADVLPTDDVEITPERPTSWKDGLSYLRDDEKPEAYRAKEAFTVYDVDGNLPPRPMKFRQEISLTYGVMFNGDLYGLPQGFVDQDIWYLFPLTKLELVEPDELYNVSMSLGDKLLLRSRLSASERSVVMFARLLAYGTKLKTNLTRKKQS